MRLPASLRRGFYGAAALVALSGAAWLVLHYVGSDDNRAATLALEVHGGAAMLLLFFAGALFWLHGPSAWHDGKNRLSGGAVATALAVLTATAYLLYYASGDLLRNGASLVHWALGIAALPLLCAHVVSGRRTR